MSKHPLLFLSILSALLFGISNCTKKDKTDLSPSSSVKQSDQSGSSAVDAAMDDVNDYINNNIGGGSTKNTRLETYNLPCGIIRIDTSTIVNGHRAYRIQYGDSNSCENKKKSGEVSFQLVQGTSFNQAGAIFKITYKNYVVEIVSTGDVVTINGDLFITNVSGGYVWQAVTESATIQHRIRGTFTIQYVNGEIRQRQYYQLRTWSSTNGWAGLTFSVAGDTTINAVKVSEIGHTLDGNYYFETQILTNYTWSNCGNSFVGPYVLQLGNARMNVTVPGISPAYFNVEAGYRYASTTGNALKVNDCSSDAYKIDIVIGTSTSTQYQLY